MPPEIIQLPLQTRTAVVRSSTFDEEANTIEIIWTTGATVRRNSWRDGLYDEQLIVAPENVRLERLNNGAPFLNTHSSYDLSDVIGSIVPGTAKIENGRGIATVKLSNAPSDADTVGKIRDGVIRNVSAGYLIHEVEKREADDGSVPVWRVTDWEPLEISAVPVGADPGAQMRSAGSRPGDPDLFPCVVSRADAPSAAPAAPQLENRMPPEVDAQPDLTTENRAAPVAGNPTVIAPQPGTTAAPQPAPVDAQAQIRAERERSATILTIGQRAGLSPEIISTAIADGTSADAFRARGFDHMADEAEKTHTRPSARAQITGASEEEKRGGALENALLHRFDPTKYELTEHGRTFRGMTILEMGRDCLEAAGVRTRGLSKNELAGAMLSMRSDTSMMAMRSGGMLSTGDFPNVLANVANKTLRAGYQAAPQTFRSLVRVVTVPDFKQVSRVQLGEAPQLEKVNEHGEFKRGSMGDAAEKYAVSTYGKIVGITRQVLINDDLDAFTRIPRSFGVAAANLESDLVWGQITGNPVMADGLTLFHAKHGNLGTAAAIAADSVGAGRQSMRVQKGLDGKTLLNITPTYLLVPTALETTTEQFLGQIFPTKAADVVTTSMKKLVPISEPRLDAASSTNWYLAGDPGQIDVIELAYLEGAQGLYTETRMGFDVDGIEVKVRQDVGAKVIDWRGLYKNPV
ncbi:prohead serine protease [Faunimonas pinastri]|uniref:Prohead serine protease n=1 Tax=Faunimonas pinastri TaxID=1855383 RepID=A0A1H9GFF6_9HYPH|nr:prohead protease/major capsid protein fusion protein [Faunimonas pinastri]SEQ48816.1 prohead serine protease [Faunimonas pinastri]